MKTDKSREQRRRQTLELLEKYEILSVEELATHFQVTGATIRSDLAALMDRKQVIRMRGSAMLARKNAVSPLVDRLRTQTAEKKSIGRTAAALVENGDIIGLDGSSTALAMTPFLSTKQNLTVVTNCIAVANELIGKEHIRIIMPGGQVKHDSASVVGTSVVEYLTGLRLKAAFVGARSMSPDLGLGEVDQEEVDVKKTFLQIAQMRVALVDSSKWEEVSLVTFAPWENIDCLITDDGLAEEHQRTLESHGVRVKAVEVDDATILQQRA